MNGRPAERPSGSRGRERPEGPWTHDQAVVNDVRLHYVAAGDESDPLVLLLHGFPEFWYSWRHQIPALADAGLRVVAPDMRGYNTSEKPPGLASYRMEKLVGDVVEMIEHFGREQARVVGHDWGGLVAWATAIRRPEVVEKLVVLNAPHLDRYRRELLRNPEQWGRSLYVLYFQIPRLPEALLTARNCAGIAEMLRETSRPETFGETDLRRYREAACRPGTLTAALNYYRAAFRENLRREIRGFAGGERPNRRVRVPTLLLWGEDDPALDVALTEGLDEWVPDLRVERFPETTHWLQNERPEAVTEALLAFFEE